MPLVKIIRHGFEFWEAPHCMRPPLPPLPKTKSESRLTRLANRSTEYHRRLKPSPDAPNITVLPSIPPELTNIQEMVIQAFSLTNEEFYGRCRTEKVANARIASMALCRAYTGRTVEEIAKAHNRGHHAASYASFRFAELQQSHPAFAAAIARIEETLLQEAA